MSIAATQNTKHTLIFHKCTKVYFHKCTKV